MRLLAQLVGVLLVVGLVGAYFWWIVAALAAVARVYFARRWWLAHRQRVAEREAEHGAIAARADQQHAWVLAGDDRGVCGAYPPAITGFRNGRPRSPLGVCERTGQHRTWPRCCERLRGSCGHGEWSHPA